MPGAVEESFDYVVVGSGAGGGPLAANLALAGFRVLVLEAGGEATGPLYDIPVFHGFAAEDPEMAWSFFVRHYQSTEQQRRDSKFTPEHDGVLYPRAGTLGGCTAHNAMITITPEASDWDGIAQLTGDESWYSRRMHHYFQRLENCAYVDSLTNFAVVLAWRKLQRLVYRALGQPDLSNPGQHGLQGWLHTQMPDVGIGLSDHELMLISVLAIEHAASRGLEANAWFGRAVATFDPNDVERDKRTLEGFVFTPLATRDGRRNGARERILEVREKHPDRLAVRLHALVTRVLFDSDRRATGVEYLEGARLYRADPGSTGADAPRRTVHASREVILSAGAFNTPQLLKLSGVGPAEELRRHNIPVVVDLPGVGENLQDRYEVGVISEMATNFSALETASFVPPESFASPEPAVQDWQMGAGIYTSNGAIGGTMLKSSSDKPVPDLFVFGLPGYFKGYFPGYSKELLAKRNLFTWAILKAHTDNTAGQVLLRSADPRDTPDIQFHYFAEGNDKEGDDLRAVVEGVKYARGIMARAGNHVVRELLPGPALQSDEQIGQFIRDEAWGHHASCSARIGADGDPMAVLDSRFRVRGVKGLRVVDASAFPRIPGFFIVAAVYMISEKASDVIVEDARGARSAA